MDAALTRLGDPAQDGVDVEAELRDDIAGDARLAQGRGLRLEGRSTAPLC
ncbi:hypothetical protein [Streptomyces sp. P9-A2]